MEREEQSCHAQNVDLEANSRPIFELTITQVYIFVWIRHLEIVHDLHIHRASRLALAILAPLLTLPSLHHSVFFLIFSLMIPVFRSSLPPSLNLTPK